MDGDINCHTVWEFKGLLLKMAMEIVDLPIKNMVIFHSYVRLPEGSLGYVLQFREMFGPWLKQRGSMDRFVKKKWQIQWEEG